MYLNLNQLFEKYKGKNGIGAFNVHCMEMFPYIIEGAKKAGCPVIVQTSKGTAEYLGLDWLVTTARIFSKDIDLCLHLDHCTDVDFVKKAIDSGYSSVMYDGSFLPIEENIKNTIEVVTYAKEHNVSVEGEIGHIGGSEDGVEEKVDSIKYTKVEDAIEFVDKTKVNALAVAIGTVHGLYNGEAKIDFELLESLTSNLGNVGLVLHGGTGVSEIDFNKCAKMGMMKFNVGTELNKAYIENINNDFKGVKPTTSLRKLFKNANDSIIDIVYERSVNLKI